MKQKFLKHMFLALLLLCSSVASAHQPSAPAEGTYKLKYVVNGEDYLTFNLAAGSAVYLPEAPQIENYEFVGWCEKLDIASNANAMLYTNAPCTSTSYGDQFTSWDVLFDDNTVTIFHSEYANKESADGLDHYLRVDMGEGNSITYFTFTYTNRDRQSEQNAPKTMIVEGSNSADGDYNELAVLTDLPSIDNYVYRSDTIGNGTPYRYIRYRVTETAGGRTVYNHPYFHISEFGMTDVAVSTIMPAKDFVLTAAYKQIAGTCGENATWSLADGVLTIGGTGAMTDFEVNGTPWNDSRDGITSVVVEEGITHIGNYAFHLFESATSVSLPSSVTSIGESALMDNPATDINIPQNVQSIGENAFRNSGISGELIIPSTMTVIEPGVFRDCKGLTSLFIGSGIDNFYNTTFLGCTNIESIVVSSDNTAFDSREGCNAIINTTTNSLVTGCKNTVIPASVTKIARQAFDGCTGLTSITIPASVTSIGYEAFCRCSSLESVNIPAGLTTIEYGTFSRTGLKSVVIPEGVTTLGAWAFDNCPALESVSLPSTIQNIENYAFQYSSALDSVVVAATTPATLGSNVFDGISENSTLYVPTGAKATYEATSGWNAFANIEEILIGTCGANATWTLVDGVLTISGTGAMTDYEFSGAPWYEYREDITSVVVKEGITHIGDFAFNGCLGLTSVTIPGSVTSIGDYAFQSGDVLTSITIPASVTSIGYRAFYGCPGLTSIEVESGNTKYDSRGGCNAIIETATNTLIAGCKNTIIPEGVTSIGDEAFEGCRGLTSVTIPGSVTSIGNSAFTNCSGLTSIEIPGSVTTIGNATFDGCDGLTSIVIPASVTSIGLQLFSSCNNLTSIEVESGNTKYDSRGGCNAIIETATNTLIAGCKNTIIPEGVTSIGDFALFHCLGLTSIEIPASVTTIGSAAFTWCYGLTSIIIPEGVTSIENCAFEYCYGLKSITSLIPAEDLFAIDSYVFNGVDKTACTLYVLTGAKATYEATDGWNEFTNIEEILSGTCGANATWTLVDGVLTIRGTGAMTDYEYNATPWNEYREDITSVVVKEGITHIGDYAFSDCGFTSITIPAGVTSIGNSAFLNCSGLTSITIPAGATSIGNSAFNGCTGLTSITIPAGVTDIGVGAFQSCYGLTSIEVESGNTKYDSRGGCNAIIETATNTLIAGCKNTIIPGSVTSIGNYAFDGCTGLTSITIPGSVTSIGNYAFWGCIGLTSITIPDSVTSIGNYAFYGCDGLTSVTIGNGVTSIGEGAFSGCPGLTSITIPAGVTSIGNYAFWACPGLTSIEVESGNTKYDSRGGCNAIIETATNTLIAGCKNTIIPEGVTSIRFDAFNGCTGLTSITIPGSVTSIGFDAFSFCPGLTSITSLILPEDLFAIDSSVFDVDKTACTLYVPYGAKATYEATDGWSEFTNIEEIDEVTITINQYGSATYSSRYALDFSEVEGLNAYAATAYNVRTQVVTLTRVNTAQEGIGLFLKGEPGEYIVPIIEQSDDCTLNMLVGTQEQTTINATSDDDVYANYVYTIKAGDEEPLFYRASDNLSLPSGKAYMQIPLAWLPATPSRALAIRFDNGTTTDIDAIESNKEDGIYYDLSGRPVANPSKGIYILNGKKVFVK